MFNKLNGDHWLFTTFEEADIVVISLDENSTQDALDAKNNSDKITVVYGKEKTDHPWHMSPGGGADEFMSVFSDIYASLNNQKPSQAVASFNSFDKLMSFFNQLKNKKNTLISFGNDIQLIYDSKEYKVEFITPKNLSMEAYATLLSSADFSVAKFSEPVSVNHNETVQFDSFSFFWKLFQFISIGAASDEHNKTVYKQMHWPPLTMVPHKEHDLAISALLMKGSFDIYTISGKARCQLEDVYRYILSCLSINFLELCTSPASEALNKNQPDDKKVSLLGKLFQKLQQIKKGS